LEKAYAKIYGSYEKIEAGIAGHALRDLTGAPYEYFIRDDESPASANKCWDFIYKFFQKKYLLAASSESSTQVLRQYSLGHGIRGYVGYNFLTLLCHIES